MNIRIKDRDAAAKVLQVLKDAGGHDRELLTVRKQLEDIVNRPANTDTFLRVKELAALVTIGTWLDTAHLPANDQDLRDAAAIVVASLPRLVVLLERRREVERAERSRLAGWSR